jgi:predicted outer membrane repeat protein
MKARTLVIAVALLVPAVSPATVRVVRPDGGGDFATIQLAVAASIDGDVVELTEGVFTGEGNRDIDYQGKAITVRSQGGDPASCVINCQGSEADPHRGFLFHLGEGGLSRLEGVTVRGGRAQQEVNGADGGAVACRNGSSPAFANCIFRACSAGGPPGGGTGGGVASTGASAPSFDDCVFESNSAYFGGGLRCEASSGATCVGCVFLENDAALGAGAMLSGDHLTLEGCTFSGNFCPWDGGAVCVDGGLLTMTGCTVFFNGSLSGAAIALWGGPSAVIDNTLIAFDESGAAIACGAAAPLLSCCDLYGNPGGDWTGPIADQLGIRGNIHEDPMFCSPAPHEDRDWTIRDDSPCAPAQSDCGLVGAWGVGCEVTPVVPSTWGRIKAGFGG